MPQVTKTSDWIRNWCSGKGEVFTMNNTTKDVTFAGSTTGAQAAKDLFDVTGLILCTVFGICRTTDLVGSSATIQIGTANATDLIIGAATAESIDAGDVFIDATAIGEAEEHLLDLPWILTNGQDLAYEVVTANITAGLMRFYCLWYAISSDAAVVPSGVNQAV